MKQVPVIVLISIVLLASLTSCQAISKSQSLVCAADQPEKYLALLGDKNVALMANHTSLVDSMHLLDFLMSKQVQVKKIFAIEHGFRGDAANGEQVSNTIDYKTGVPIVSLYGDKKKPSTLDFENIDMVIFDMQDVGCRFYTYISSMHLLMEACAANNVELIILDRPNPNGDYIAGPVLNLKLKSFVGMHPIPVVHGCTVGELALMINGEGWLENEQQCKLTVIPVKNYTHSTTYIPPVKPSPNLPNYQSIRLYPSLCFFEGTNISIGRGTDFPFQVIGFPGFDEGDFRFTPETIPGVSVNPIHEGEQCGGIDLRKQKPAPVFTLNYFLQFHDLMGDSAFWKSKKWFEMLSGSENLYHQINDGLTEEQLMQSWQSDIEHYKSIREKYLLYTDFE